MSYSVDERRRSAVLLVPGWTGSGPDHWQSVWQRHHPAYRRVEQRDWDQPQLSEWQDALADAVRATEGRPVLVAHSLGCVLVAHWAASGRSAAAAALLVAPPDLDQPNTPAELRAFAPVPRARLPFPAVLVASRNDPFASFERSRALAVDWGAEFVDAGAVGHINTAANLGRWPFGEVLLERLLCDERTASAEVVPD